MELTALGHGWNCPILSHAMTTPEKNKTHLIVTVVNETVLFKKKTKKKNKKKTSDYEIENAWEINKQGTFAYVWFSYSDIITACFRPLL